MRTTEPKSGLKMSVSINMLSSLWRPKANAKAPDRFVKIFTNLVFEARIDAQKVIFENHCNPIFTAPVAISFKLQPDAQEIIWLKLEKSGVGNIFLK